MSEEFDLLFPFERHYHRQSAGHQLHYVDSGPVDGQPVVMVHGNPSWSFYYRNMIQALDSECRCLALDHIGMGLSDRPGDDAYHYTLASRVADLGHWLDAVEPEREIDLIVHDWGGAIALSWAVQNPERVRRIVALNTWAFTIPDHLPLPASLKIARSRAGRFAIRRFNAFSGLAARLGSARGLDRQVSRALTAPYRKGPESRLATLRFVEDIPLTESDPAWPMLASTESQLARLADKAVCFIWGGKDPVFNDGVLEHWRKIWPQADVEYLEQAGHYVLEDAPEHVVAKARAFLGASD